MLVTLGRNELHIFMFIIFIVIIICVASFGKNMDVACLSNVWFIFSSWKKMLFWASLITSRNCVRPLCNSLKLIAMNCFSCVADGFLALDLVIQRQWSCENKKRRTQNCQARGFEILFFRTRRYNRPVIIRNLKEYSCKTVARRIPDRYHDNEMTQPLSVLSNILFKARTLHWMADGLCPTIDFQSKLEKPISLLKDWNKLPSLISDFFSSITLALGDTCTNLDLVRKRRAFATHINHQTVISPTNPPLHPRGRQLVEPI